MDPQDRRALYSEAGLMVRMCDTLTASFIQYYAAIVVAAVAAVTAGKAPIGALALMLGPASLIFLLLATRIRRNYKYFLESATSLEAELLTPDGDPPCAPHAHSERRKRGAPPPASGRRTPDEFAPVPTGALYPMIYVLGLLVAAVAGVWSALHEGFLLP